MVYAWNDIVDYETDALNPRKDSFWFGARASKDELANLWKPIVIIQLIFIAPLIYLSSIKLIPIFLGFFIINGLYNLPKNGLRSRPPLELLCQVGYLLVVPFSIILNNTAALPWQTYLYLFLFAMQSHLMGEVMDIEPDRKSGRKTTATILGYLKVKLLIISLMLAEITILFISFREFVFGSVLVFGVLWLLVDALILYKSKTYTLGQMKLFALSSNLIGFVTIAYVWYSGCLVETT